MPMGHHFGVPFHRELQRRVLVEMFDMVENDSEPGTIRDLKIKWGDVRRQAKALTAQGQQLVLERAVSDRTGDFQRVKTRRVEDGASRFFLWK